MIAYASIRLNAIIELNGPFVGTIARLKRICPECGERIPAYYVGTDGACLDCYMAAHVPVQTGAGRRVDHA